MKVMRFKLGQMLSPLLLLLVWPVYSQQEPKPAVPSKAEGKFTLGTCVNEFTASRAKSTKAGYQYWFIDKDFLDGRTVKMSVVKAHAATHEPHRHPEDEIFFVLEGTAEVFLDGNRMEIHPYATFYCPPNSEHGIRNVGEIELKYLVLKTIPK